MRLEPRTKR